VGFALAGFAQPVLVLAGAESEFGDRALHITERTVESDHEEILVERAAREEHPASA